MFISSNNSLQRRISKFVVHFSLWNNIFVSKCLKFLTQRPRLFSAIITHIEFINERYELEVFRRFVKPGMVVLDIGANVGLYTAEASHLVGNKGHVIAFEPDKFNFDMLKGCIKNGNYRNVILENMALSNKKGLQKLFIDSVNPGNHSFGKKNLYKGHHSILVPTISLDEYLSSKRIKRVDIIKIDVQGAEALVFSGALDLLRHQYVTIMMEYWPVGIKNVGQNPEQLLRLLSDCGYKFKVIEKNNKTVYPISLSNLVEYSRKWKDSTDYTNLILYK